MNTRFIKFLFDNKAVMKGDFTLKNGTKSNMFFNFGNICSGHSLLNLGEFFADRIVDGCGSCTYSSIFNNIDVLYGPAYKGISIAASASIALRLQYNIDIPFAYGRKESKGHGETGNYVGYDLSKVKTVLMLDDVITDGETKRQQALKLIEDFPNISSIFVLVGLDIRICTNNRIFSSDKRVFSLTTLGDIKEWSKWRESSDPISANYDIAKWEA